MTFDPIEERDATIAELRTRLSDPWDLEGNAAAMAWRKKADAAEATIRRVEELADRLDARFLHEDADAIRRMLSRPEETS